MIGILAFQILVVMSVMTWYGANVLRLIDDYFHSEFRKYLNEEGKRNPILLRDKDQVVEEQLAFKINDQFLPKERRVVEHDGKIGDKFPHQYGDQNYKGRDSQVKSSSDQRYTRVSYTYDDDHGGSSDSIRSGAKGGRDLKTQTSFKEFQVADHLNGRHRDELGQSGSLDFSKEAFLSDDDTYEFYNQEKSFDDETGDPFPLLQAEHFRLISKSAGEDYHIHERRENPFNCLAADDLLSGCDLGEMGQNGMIMEESSTGNKKYCGMSDRRGLHPSIRTIQNDNGGGIKSTCSSGSGSRDFEHFPHDEDHFDKDFGASWHYSKYEEESSSTATSAFYSSFPLPSTTTTRHDQSQSIHFDKEANLVKEVGVVVGEEDDVKVEESVLNEDRKNGKVNSDGFNFHFQQENDVCHLLTILKHGKDPYEHGDSNGCDDGGGGGGTSSSLTTHLQDEVDILGEESCSRNIEEEEDVTAFPLCDG